MHIEAGGPRHVFSQHVHNSGERDAGHDCWGCLSTRGNLAAASLLGMPTARLNTTMLDYKLLNALPGTVYLRHAIRLDKPVRILPMEVWHNVRGWCCCRGCHPPAAKD